MADSWKTLFRDENRQWEALGVRLYYFRWVMIAVNMAFGAATRHMGGWWPVFYIGVFGVTLAVAEWLRRRYGFQRLNRVMLPLDVCMITLSIHLAGGLASSKFLLYLVEVLFAILYFGSQAGLWVGAGTMGIYALLVWEQIGTEAQMYDFIYRVVTILMISIGVGYLGDFLRKQVLLNRRLATVDVLTGLGNSRVLWEEMDALLVRHREEQKPFHVLMFDCDNLKKVNDRFGHEAGDRMIRHVAQVADGVFTPSGRVFRYAGDEFYVLFGEEEHERVRMLAEAFVQEVRRQVIDYLGESIVTSVSVGSLQVAEPFGYLFTRAEVVRKVDAALYESKKSGKGRVTYRFADDALEGEESVS